MIDPNVANDPQVVQLFKRLVAVAEPIRQAGGSPDDPKIQAVIEQIGRRCQALSGSRHVNYNENHDERGLFSRAAGVAKAVIKGALGLGLTVVGTAAGAFVGAHALGAVGMVAGRALGKTAPLPLSTGLPASYHRVQTIESYGLHGTALGAAIGAGAGGILGASKTLQWLTSGNGKKK